jgi:uncharacterized protein YeaO (DUF488 family)
VIRVVRLGSPRAKDEGLRLGTARRPPRGVKKEDYAKQNYFDVWFPDVAPSQPLVSWALSEPWTDTRWARYVKSYRSEMREPAKQRVLELLARLSHQTNFSVGCYCENADRCHRAILRELLLEHGAEISSARDSTG